MKHAILGLALLVLGTTASAQTFTVTTDTVLGHSGNDINRSGIPLEDNASIGWLNTATTNSCVGGPAGTGYIYLDGVLDIPTGCIPLTGRSASTTIVVDPKYPTRCSGPSWRSYTFAGSDSNNVPFTGTVTLYLSYRFQAVGSGRGGGGVGCFESAIAGESEVVIVQ